MPVGCVDRALHFKIKALSIVADIDDIPGGSHMFCNVRNKQIYQVFGAKYAGFILY